MAAKVKQDCTTCRRPTLHSMNELAAQLQALLAAELGPEAADMLLPIIAIRADESGSLLIDVPNALWAQAVRMVVLPVAQRWLDSQQPGFAITVVDRDTSVAAEIRQDTTFDDLLSDPGNQLAAAACVRVCEQPGLEHNPLYLHGPSGCGKTHLLRAIAHEFRQMLGASAAVLLDGPEFVATGAQDLSRRASDGLRGELDQAAVIIVDRIDALASRDLAQEELFHVVNAALDRGVQLVLAGRLAPRRIDGLTDRLASRLAWGLTVGIETPHLETRVALLRRIAGTAVNEVDADRLTALVDSQAPDMHQVVELAERLTRGGVDLAQATRPAGAGFDRILQVVAEHFQLRPADLASKRRHREIVYARGVALLLARRLTPHSLGALGGMVGGRDHTTVLHALATTEERLAHDADLQRTVAELTRQVLHGG